MKYRCCPKCGFGMNQDSDGNFYCLSCKFVFWQNSKPTVTAIISWEGKVLLGQRNIEPFNGWLDLPGGFLKYGEHPIDGLKREIREEIGVDIMSCLPHGIFMDTYNYKDDIYSILCLHYRVWINPNDIKKISAGDDMETLTWVSMDQLDIDKVAFNANQESLKKFLKDYNKDLDFNTIRG